MVVSVLRDARTEARQAVFAGDNDGLREGLRRYNEYAVAEASYQRVAGAEWEWRGFYDHRTWAFIRGAEMWEDYGIG